MIKREFDKFYGDVDSIDFELIDDIGIGFYAYKNGKYGIVDRFGKVLLDFLFDVINKFEGDYSVVKYNGKFGVIDKNLRFVLDFMFSSITISKDKRLAFFSLDGKYGYLVFDLEYKSPLSFYSMDMALEHYKEIRKSDKFGDEDYIVSIIETLADRFQADPEKFRQEMFR